MVVFTIPTFFALAGTGGIDWDMVFTAIHPFVIIIVVARAIGMKAYTLERNILITKGK